MNLKIFPLLSTSTKRRIQKITKRRGFGSKRKYHYVPSRKLVTRLANELRISESQVRKQIAEERLYLLQQLYGDEISLSDV